MKNILKVFCCGLFFAAVVGCSSVNTVENADFGSGAKMVSDKRIITDDGLDDIAYIAGERVQHFCWTSKNTGGTCEPHGISAQFQLLL